jgi:hypothetical protein
MPLIFGRHTNPKIRIYLPVFSLLSHEKNKHQQLNDVTSNNRSKVMDEKFHGGWNFGEE